jgi:hypothetical protein
MLGPQEYNPHSRYDMQFLCSVGADGGVGTQDVTAISTEVNSLVSILSFNTL